MPPPQAPHLPATAPTRAGARTLADWLQEPASLEEIRARQTAVDDLRDRLDLREEMFLRAAAVPPGIDLDRLIDWTAEQEGLAWISG